MVGYSSPLSHHNTAIVRRYLIAGLQITIFPSYSAFHPRAIDKDTHQN